MAKPHRLLYDMAQLRARMLALSDDMDEYDGNDSEEVKHHARQLRGAAGIVATWINGLEVE